MEAPILKIKRGAIKNFELPKHFFKVEETHGGRGSRWQIIYGASIRKDVQIGFFYRGVSLDPIDTSIFRRLLGNVPNLIFFHKSNGVYSVREKKLLQELKDILDNAGDNQVINLDSNFVPQFYLESLETVRIKERPMLLIKGYYLSLERKPTNYLYALLFDRDSQSPHCFAEEIFFQASTKELYNKYFLEFKKSLESIEF